MNSCTLPGPECVYICVDSRDKMELKIWDMELWNEAAGEKSKDDYWELGSICQIHFAGDSQIRWSGKEKLWWFWVNWIQLVKPDQISFQLPWKKFKKTE